MYVGCTCDEVWVYVRCTCDEVWVYMKCGCTGGVDICDKRC